jgi:chemotaxis protein CheC
LNDVHIDALREIGNIGAGNAATSLGVLLNEDVNISIPEVKIEDFEQVAASVGGLDEMCVAVLINFTGDAKGVMLFLLSMDDAKGITDIFTGEDEEGLSDLKMSGIKEFGNILSSSYLGSVASLTGMEIHLSVPNIAIDMAGAILTTPVIEYGATDSKVMFIEESFNTKERKLKSRVIMFTDMDTLQEIMSRLRLEI